MDNLFESFLKGYGPFSDRDESDTIFYPKAYSDAYDPNIGLSRKRLREFMKKVEDDFMFAPINKELLQKVSDMFAEQFKLPYNKFKFAFDNNRQLNLTFAKDVKIVGDTLVEESTKDLIDNIKVIDEEIL